MTIVKVFWGLASVVAAAPAPLRGAELQRSTLKAWGDYIRNADLRVPARLNAQQPFLWTDESPDRKRRVKAGEIVVAPVVGHGTQDVPNGLIHDWVGAVFIPHTTLTKVLTIMHDYDAYKDFYKPVVVESKALACTEMDQEFSMTWQRRVLFVTAALEIRYQAHHIAVDARRGYGVVDSTRVQEIVDYGRAEQHLLPPDNGSGFIWRLHSTAKYEERDGGVYIELEAIALSRDIPDSLRWLVKPVVNHLSSNSLTATLRQTRDAINSLAEQPERLARCPNREAQGLPDTKPISSSPGLGVQCQLFVKLSRRRGCGC